jgi:hypothetical protein
MYPNHVLIFITADSIDWKAAGFKVKHISSENAETAHEFVLKASTIEAEDAQFLPCLQLGRETIILNMCVMHL